MAIEYVLKNQEKSLRFKPMIEIFLIVKILQIIILFKNGIQFMSGKGT